MYIYVCCIICNNVCTGMWVYVCCTRLSVLGIYDVCMFFGGNECIDDIAISIYIYYMRIEKFETRPSLVTNVHAHRVFKSIFSAHPHSFALSRRAHVYNVIYIRFGLVQRNNIIADNNIILCPNLSISIVPPGCNISNFPIIVLCAYDGRAILPTHVFSRWASDLRLWQRYNNNIIIIICYQSPKMLGNYCQSLCGYVIIVILERPDSTYEPHSLK